MVVDPDGFVWLAPWRPESYRNEPMDAVVVDPRSGVVRRVSLPRFPAAFLPDARFIAVRYGAAGAPELEAWGIVPSP
jgi:hypothetical protein